MSTTGDQGESHGAIGAASNEADASPQSGVFFAVIDCEGLLIGLSPSLESHLGYEPLHLAGSRAIRIFPEADLEWLATTLGEQDPATISFFGRVIHIDGRVEEMGMMATSLRGPSGLCATLIHSTDRVPPARVEEAIERSQRRFRALVQNSPFVISVLDHEGTWLESSDAGTRLLGYPRGFDPPGGLLSLVHESDQELAERALEEVISGARSPTDPVEIRFRDASGHWHTFESFGQNLLDDQAVGGVVVWAHDVTQRKQLEDQLRESEERFRVIAEAATEGISIVESGQVVGANASFETMYGYGPNEVIGLPVTAFLPQDTSDDLLAAVENHESHTSEHYVLRKDGSRLLVTTTGRTITFQGRQVRVATHTDLTEHLEIASLLERRRLARDLHDGLAHELAYIAAKTRALLQGEGSKTLLQDLASASERALDEARRAIVVLSNEHPEPLELGIVQTVEDLASRHSLMPHLELAPSVDLAPDVCEQLLRVVREAITNAARHGAATEVWVRLFQDNGVHLTIEDNGVGFDVNQGDVRGFGLVSMRERADVIGATLMLSSTSGAGTRVEIVLP